MNSTVRRLFVEKKKVWMWKHNYYLKTLNQLLVLKISIMYEY